MMKLSPGQSLRRLAHVPHVAVGAEAREALVQRRREEPLVDADVDEARLQHLLVGRVDELLVVHPPRVLALVLVRVVADGVALEGVGLELGDRAVHFLQPAGIAGREDRMRHEPPRAEPRVDLGARLHRHVIGEEPVLRHLGGRARDERDLGVRVEEDLLEVIVELQVLKCLRLPSEAGIPAGPSDRLALAHEALEARVVAEEMRVGVHHELSGEPPGALRRQVLVGGLGQARVEEGAEHLVHGHVGRRHPAGGAEEGAAGEPPLATELVAQRRDARLDAPLLGALGRGKILVARHDLGGNRPRKGRCLGRFESPQLVVTQEPHGVLPSRRGPRQSRRAGV